MAIMFVDNVDNCFCIVHIVHMAILLCASRFEAWTFVDNVDNVDARFKLVADEASTCVDTLAYIYLTLFSLILVTRK